MGKRQIHRIREYASIVNGVLSVIRSFGAIINCEGDISTDMQRCFAARDIPEQEAALRGEPLPAV